MADVELNVGGRSYAIACRDGGEEHLRTLAAHVDKKAQEAASAVGGMSESRQLLFAALLIADELTEAAAAIPGAPAPAMADPALAGRIETAAARIEALADALEANGLEGRRPNA